MPVGTQASLKGLTPEQLEDTGCRLCLNNTYHLWVTSGASEDCSQLMDWPVVSSLDKQLWTPLEERTNYNHGPTTF